MFLDHLMVNRWYAAAVPAGAVFTRYIFNHKTGEARGSGRRETITGHGLRREARVNLNATRDEDGRSDVTVAPSNACDQLQVGWQKTSSW